MTERWRGVIRAALGALALGTFALFVPSCATTGAEGQGDLNLPTTGVGPFRKLGVDEVPGIAPFVFDDRTAFFREPAVLSDPSTASGNGVILYAVAKQAGVDVIVRTRADDARAFLGTTGDSGKPPVVLSADAPWEGTSVSGPFALRRNDEVLLYYAAAGGIGVARSSDGGLTFHKEAGPVLARDRNAAWESTEVHAPAVYVLGGGQVRLLYTAGAAIGEAESLDGVHFTRVDPDPSTPLVEPILSPAAHVAPGSLLPNERPPFDTASVGDPCVSVRMTPAERLQVRVLYTGADDLGTTAIGFAARYGDSGRLTRNAAPVYSVGAGEAAPAFLEVPGGSFLYVQQNRRADAQLTYVAIAAAFAPGTVHLPMPLPYPSSP